MNFRQWLESQDIIDPKSTDKFEPIGVKRGRLRASERNNLPRGFQPNVPFVVNELTEKIKKALWG